MQWAKVGLDTHIGDGHQSMNQDVPILLGFSFWDDHQPKKKHALTLAHMVIIWKILETIAIV